MTETGFRIGATLIELHPDGYTRMEISEAYGRSVTLADAKEICKAIYELNEGKKSKSLVVSINSDGVFMETGVKEEFANSPYVKDTVMAEAYVMDSFAKRIIIRFYAKMVKGRKIRSFKTEEKAVEWLTQLEI